ncbi:MAG: HAMP domain-containing protein [Solirubrobacterales bacterium]|nr:HAMP domain-containing protein [Solirubrobacterales bacterium]
MKRLSATLARLPTRVRVTLAFAAVMAALLTALGLFLYLRLGATLNATIDAGLRSRAGDVTALIQQADSGLAEAGRSPLTEQGESLAQVLDVGGRVVDAPPPLRGRALLSPAEVRRAARGTIVVEHRAAPGSEGRVRLLATPVTAQDRRSLVVVGASLDASEEAQRELAGLLLVGGPVALLLASLAGYGAAAGALRPVELMRRRAGEIQAARPGRRLPVPPSGDEITRLGQTLNHMLDRLEGAFARERQFVSDASHELRTPLAILKGELELALRDETDVAGFRSAVMSAAEEADRLVQLAEDLLVIARSDQGRLPVRLAEVDVEQLLESAAQRFGRRAAEHGASLRVQAPEELRLIADQLRLEQAVGNLIDNALRHGGSTIEVVGEATSDRVRLHVLDDGAGFPPEFVASAFERFTRADSARGRGGAGLGLAIVQAIARAHGGEAYASNRAEGGADVCMDLPAEAPAVAHRGLIDVRDP